MREIIQKIITTESEAKLAVEAARVEADSILSDVKKKGHDIIEQARQETLIEAEKIVKAVVEEARREKQNRLDTAVDEIENQIQLEPSSRKWAVEGVVRCVCKQP